MRIMELDGEDLVQDFSNEIERMLGSKMKSVKVSHMTEAAPGGPEVGDHKQSAVVTQFIWEES